jgi:hypothetical protein
MTILGNIDQLPMALEVLMKYLPPNFFCLLEDLIFINAYWHIYVENRDCLRDLC